MLPLVLMSLGESVLSLRDTIVSLCNQSINQVLGQIINTIMGLQISTCYKRGRPPDLHKFSGFMIWIQILQPDLYFCDFWQHRPSHPDTLFFPAVVDFFLTLLVASMSIDFHLPYAVCSVRLPGLRFVTGFLFVVCCYYLNSLRCHHGGFPVTRCLLVGSLLRPSGNKITGLYVQGLSFHILHLPVISRNQFAVCSVGE